MQQWRCAHDTAVAVPELDFDLMSCLCAEAMQRAATGDPADNDGLREFWVW